MVEAPNGVNGGTCDMEGKNAAHKIIDVPMGTLFRNLDREIVAEVDKEGSMFLAARGGEGGKGNAFFKSSDQQKPLIAEKGGQGEAFTFDIGTGIHRLHINHQDVGPYVYTVSPHMSTVSLVMSKAETF